jgi:hypothetical protein
MKIKHADVKRKKSLKILLFGDSGTGKTHMALKSTPGKVLIFDAESGADFFEGRDGFNFDYVTDDDGLKTSSIEELRKAILYLATKEGREKYDTFIIDPISDIWDNIQSQRSEFKDVVNSRKRVEKRREAINETDLEAFNQKDWGDMKRVYKNMMLDLKNLPQNIFLLAREKEISISQPDGGIIKTGEYTFEAEKNTKYAVDFTVRLMYDEKANKRSAYIVKSRAEGAEKGEVVDDPTFSIFDSVVNSMAGGIEPDKMSTRSENVFQNEENALNGVSDLKNLQQKVIARCVELGGSKNEELMRVVKLYEPSGNTNRIKDSAKLSELLTKLESVQPLEKGNE